jgi:hypothetical protein
MSLGIASGAFHPECLLLPTPGSPGNYWPGANSCGQLCRQAAGGSYDKGIGKGRGKVIGLLGTLGRLLLDCRMHTLPRGHAERCDGTLHATDRCGEDLNPEARTHRLGTVSAAVPRLILGQPLFLLVQRPRLKDHLLQLKGGITVQAAFLWRDRVLSPACGFSTTTPTAWSHLSGHSGLTLGTKPGSTFFSLRSSHSTWASDGAVCMSWRLENRCSGFTVRSCKEGPSQIKPQRRMATCLRLGRPLKVSIEQGSEPQDRKWLVRKGGIKGYGPRDSLIPVPHIQGQQRSCRDVLPRFASRWQ